MWNRFGNDRLCIDFAATVFGPTHFPNDLLRHPSDLTRWIEESGVVDDARRLDTPELIHAKAVRLTISESLHDLRRGRRPIRADLQVRLNVLAAGPRPLLQTHEGHVVRSGGFEAFVTELVIDSLDLFSEPGQVERVRWCAMPLCRRVFLDRSATAHRTWCSKRCRDQANAAQYRSRRDVTAVHGAESR